MNYLTLVYLGDYQIDEEAAFAREHFPTVRVREGVGATPPRLLQTLPRGRLLVRSVRLKKNEYEGFWNTVRSIGAQPVTSPRSFEVMNSFRLHYPAIEGVSPKAVVADANMSDECIVDLIKHSGLKAPIFVRTEVESAAKYVGTEACIMLNVDLTSAHRTIQPLRDNIKSFQEIVLKEVWPIATMNGNRVEYRAIGASGQLVTFDFGTNSSLPAPSAEIVRTAEHALHSLSNHGATGAVFVDLALAEDGSVMIVECKDFINGSIANVRAVAEGWRQWGRAVTA